MNKYLNALSAIFLGLCIVISSWIISQSLGTKQNDVVKTKHIQDTNRFQYIQVSGNYYIIFDKQTGDYWGNLNGEWKKHSLPSK